MRAPALSLALALCPFVQALPVAAAPVAAVPEDVSFIGRGAKLYGTLQRPPGRPRGAALLLPGPGAQSRDEEHRSGVRPREELAAELAGLGLLSLRYDRRGHGRSTGESQAAFVDHVGDGAAALALLRERLGPAPGPLILVGHSEGALVAAALAARSPGLGGLVLLSAPAKKGSEVLDRIRHQGLTEAGVPPEQVQLIDAQQRRVYLAARGGASWDLVPREVRQQADTAWFRDLIDHDPLADLRQVTAPVLIVHGARDTKVPVSDASEVLAALRAGGNRRATLFIVPEGNHRLCPVPAGQPLTCTSAGLAQGVKRRIGEFVRSLLPKGGG